MKTNVLITAGLLLSGATFAQDVNTKSEAISQVQVKTAVADNKASASNSATATVSASSAANKAAAKADRTKKEIKELVNTQKEAVAGEAKSGISTAKQVVQENSQVSAQAGATTSTSAAVNTSKINTDGTVQAQAAVSPDAAVTTAKKVKKTGMNTAHTTATGILETGNAIKPVIKPVPVNTHLQTTLKTGARIGIQ